MTSISGREDQGNATPDWIALVREKVAGLRYGLVQITVHEGRVTQIERTEKTRLPPLQGSRSED